MRRPWVWLAVAAGVAAVLLAVPTAGAQPGTTPSLSWSVPASFDVANGVLSGASCPSASLCVAVDEHGNVVTSTDPTGGSSAWTVGSIDPANSDFPLAVACPSASLCVAVDEAGNALRSTSPAEGASSWSAPTNVSDNGLDAVSCGTSVCVAVDGNGGLVTSANSGSNWNNPVTLESGVPLTAVSCASDTSCVAVDQSGDAFASTDPTGDASHWPSVVADSIDGLTAVSCVADTQSCVAVDQSGNAVSSTDGGSTWSTPVSLSAGRLTGISCPAASLCVAVNLAGDIWDSTDPFDASPTWSSATVDAAGDPDAISCPSVSLCVAVDQGGNALSATDPDSGFASAWTTTEVDAHAGHSNAPIGASCPSSSLCVVVDESGNVSTSAHPAGGAATWSIAKVNADTNFWDVSCPTASLCVAVDADGNVFTSTHPGAGASAWSTGVSVTTAQLFGVSCPSIALCVAVDQDGNVASSTDPTNPSAWNLDSADGSNVLTAVSCPTESFCAAVDDGGDVLTSTDPALGAWSAPVRVDTTTLDLTAISCPSSSLCVAIDGAGDVLTSTDPTGDASAWTLTNVDGANLLDSISCPSTAVCVVSDSAGNVLTSADPTGDAAAAWNTRVVDAGNVLSAVSCPSAGLCVGVDLQGNVLEGLSTPSVSTESAGSIGQTTATLTGTVNPNGVGVEDCHFGYGIGSPSGKNVPCSPLPGSGTSDAAVSAQLSGLAPATTYQFRLVATTAGGTSFGATRSFTTAAPVSPPPVTHTLAVSKSGAGSGTVTSSPTGISCGTICSHSYAFGTAVTLTATVAPDSTFVGWSGACSGTGTCSVTTSADKAVTATFTLRPVSKPCVVPKVKGKTLKKAKRSIRAHACTVGKVKRASSRTVKRGHVISQKPKPGKRLKHGAKVKLVISKGRQPR